MMQPSLGSLFRLTLKLYWTSAAFAAQRIVRNWVILPGSILALLALKVASGLVAVLPLGIAGGFILGLVHLSLLTLYVSWIAQTLEGATLGWKDLISFDSALFFGLLNVGFIFFIARFVLGILLEGSGNPFPILAIGILMAVLFNPVTEIVYHHRFDGMHALSHAIHFVKDNFLEWFIPYFLFMTPFFFIGGSFESATLLLAQTDPLFPLFQAMHPWTSLAFQVGAKGGTVTLYLILILLVALASWFMLFRGALFKELDSGSRRSRAFRARM